MKITDTVFGRGDEMFKSAFSKYLTAFVLIILVSFLVLSGIITSMIKTYATEENEQKIILASDTLSEHIVNNTDSNVVKIRDYAETYRRFITPMVTWDSKLEVMITDETGAVFLSTIPSSSDEDGLRQPIISDTLGNINISVFQESGEHRIHHGNLNGYLGENHIACANEIVINGETRGYLITLISMVKEDTLLAIARNTVINSSIWVMLAAVIAVYFITERIIHPLRNMTEASKKFAKGDFETRVAVYGEDEVAELGNAFNNMAESLQNLDKMRNSFLANVSHELRTPMTTISGFIEGITSGAIPEEKREYYLDVISREVHRLSRLVSQLLDISRLESGDKKFNFTNFDVAETARIILISFEQKIDDKKLEVEFDAEYDEIPVFADKDAIHQVIYNLCHNAIKFSKEGGKFVIRITYTENKKVRVSVFDEGQSIPEEDMQLIFDRFYKSDKSRGLDKSGVGLGLYISKTIIDAHGETISADSKDGIGTEFYFTLKAGESARKLK